MKTIRIMCFAVGGYYLYQTLELLMVTATVPLMDRYVPKMDETDAIMSVQRQMAGISMTYAIPVAIAGALLILCGIFSRKIFRMLPVVLILIAAGMTVWCGLYIHAMQPIAADMAASVHLPDGFAGSFARTLSFFGYAQISILLVVPVIVMLVLYFRYVRKEQRAAAMDQA